MKYRIVYNMAQRKKEGERKRKSERENGIEEIGEDWWREEMTRQEKRKYRQTHRHTQADRQTHR